MNKISEDIARYGVVPVVVLNDPAEALPVADALLKGGLPVAEVTFRTAAAEEAIRIIAAERPAMLVGAGTVLTVDQVDRAVAAGAKFIVCPGFDPEIVDYCIGKNIPVFPGCTTASEVAWGVKRGVVRGVCGRQIYADRRHRPEESQGLPLLRQNCLLRRKLDGQGRSDQGRPVRRD